MAFNSVGFKGNNFGELKFYGSGAGKLPTANAVLSDVLDIALNTYRKGNPLGQEHLKNLNSDIKGQYYLRVSESDEEIANKFKEISKEVIQDNDDIAIITDEIKLSEVNDLLMKLGLGKDRYFLAKIMQ